MNEIKKISIPVILVILSAAFLVVSFMVYLHGGKSARWVARKMKLGGLMLSLTALLSACDPVQTAALIDTNPPWTCYMIAYPGSEEERENVFYIETESDSLITIKLPAENKIHGEIKNRTFTTFSFAIINSNDSIVQQDNILASDGVYNEINEPIDFKVDKTLEKGNYTIRFFLTDKENQPEWSEQYFNLKIE